MTDTTQTAGADKGPRIEVDPLDGVLASHPLPGWRIVAWLVMAVRASALIWATQARLDTVSLAEGSVIPQGQLRVVQHLEGGIVEAIYVSRDAVVTEGQPLLRLNLGAGGLNAQELAIRQDTLVLRRARLEAERDRVPLALPAEEAARRPDLAQAEEATHRSRIRTLEETLGVLDNQASQRRSEIRETEAQLASVRESLRLAQAEQARLAPLVERNLITRQDLTAMERDLEGLVGQRDSLTATLARTRSALQEAENRSAQALSEFLSRTTEELSDLQSELARLREQVQRASDQDFRTEIVSPIAGVVKNMRVNTIGGVVRPGEPILEVVPTEDRLVVEARINPADIAQVGVGQRAVVKLTAFDFMRYGGLEGQVTQVAADADQDQQTGAFYYRAIVETDRVAFEVEGGPKAIIPGMQAVVEVHIGDKTVMEYLIQPVLKLRHEAFRER
jgi:adhesin transport system membrane fusion protein